MTDMQTEKLYEDIAEVLILYIFVVLFSQKKSISCVIFRQGY